MHRQIGRIARFGDLWGRASGFVVLKNGALWAGGVREKHDGGVCGFPPFRQKEGERMGHGALWAGGVRERCDGGVCGFPPFRQKKGERMGHGALWAGMGKGESGEFD
jgi:hypothetical protein